MTDLATLVSGLRKAAEDAAPLWGTALHMMSPEYKRICAFADALEISPQDVLSLLSALESAQRERDEALSTAVKPAVDLMHERDALRSEVTRLREAMEPFSCTCSGRCADAEWRQPGPDCVSYRARSALKGE